MIRAIAVIPSTQIDAGRVADCVVLDIDDRRRRRFALEGQNGLKFLLDLADTPRLEHGDGLLLEDGRVVLVEAAPERLAEFRSADPLALSRLAWHLGNRHMPAEIGAGAIRIRDDYVLVEMAKKLGGFEIAFLTAPFRPEGGAYGHGGAHRHDHNHAGHGHAHADRRDDDDR